MSNIPRNTSGTARVALILGSTRDVRLCPFIASYVTSVFQEHIDTTYSSISVDTIDLREQNLPLYNEPGVPSHLPTQDTASHYAHDTTRAWSRVVAQYDAFAFLTPQYNWSIPAALKNALDYLFHEWGGKPTMMITYGSRGGLKAAMHLRDVLNGLHTKPVDTVAGLRVPKDLLSECLVLGHLPISAARAWDDDGSRQKIGDAFEELLRALP